MPNAYAGNPDSYPTSVDVPDGSDTPSSSLFVTPYEGTLDRTAYLASRLRALPATNWLPYAAEASNGATSWLAWWAAHWDAVTNRWLIGANFATGGWQLFAAEGFNAESGTTYAKIGASASIASGVVRAVENDGTNYYAAAIDSGSAKVYAQAEALSGGWLTALTPSGSDYTDVKLRVFGGTLYAFLASSSNTADTYVVYSSDHGSTWSAAQAASLMEGATPLVADNGTTLVFMASGSASSSYATGATNAWTTRSLSFLAHSDALEGLVYDAFTGNFVLVTSGSDTRMHAYASPDGIAWAETGSISLSAFAGMVPFAAATATGCVVALLTDASGNDYVVYSTDDGATWRRSQAVLPSGSGGDMIHASPGGFCLLNFAALRFSEVVGGGPAMS